MVRKEEEWDFSPHYFPWQVDLSEWNSKLQGNFGTVVIGCIMAHIGVYGSRKSTDLYVKFYRTFIRGCEGDNGSEIGN